MAGATAQELAVRTKVATVADTTTLLQKVDSPGRLYAPVTKAQLVIDMSLVIGTDVQAHDGNLDSLVGLTYGSAAFVKMTGANTFALRTLQETSDDLEATIDHDNLLNFAANEHIDWTNATDNLITAGYVQGGSIKFKGNGHIITFFGEPTETVQYKWPPDPGSADEVLSTNGAGILSWIAAPGANPGGNDTEIQFNDGGSFGGSTKLTFDKATGYIQLTGTLAFRSMNGVRFYDSDNSNYIIFTAPTNVSADVTFRLPDGDGANGEVMMTNASAILSWGGHNDLKDYAASKHFLQTAITNVSTALSTGLLKVTTGSGALSVIADSSSDWDAAKSHADGDGSDHGDVATNTGHSETTHDYAFISGSDGATDVVATELEELTDGSQTTLHSHAGGDGAGTFLDLSDTPSSYDSADIGKVVKVKDDLSGLEFTDSPVFTDIRLNGHGYFNEEVDNGNSGAADTIDWTEGNKQKSILTDDCTFTFNSPSGPCNLVLKLVQDGTGGRTVTWPGSVNWTSGTAPTLSTGASNIDIICFYFDGVSYFGSAFLSENTFLDLIDTPASYDSADIGKYVKVKDDLSGLEFDTPAGGDGVDTFLELTDTPASYDSADAGKVVRVKNDLSGLEFVEGAGGITTFVGLTDTPGDYAGEAGKYAKVNAGEDGLEFDTPAGGAGDTYTDRGDPANNDWTDANLTRNGAWHDLDCSGIVPAGAKFIEFSIYFQSPSSQGKFFGFRKKGNINTVNVLANYTQVAGIGIRWRGFIPCDTNREVQYMCNDAAGGIQLVIVGWIL